MSYSPLWDGTTVTLSLAIGTNNNVDVTQAAIALTGAVGAPFNISGLQVGWDATLNPWPQRAPLVLVNNSGQTMTLKNRSGLSALTNNIATSSGADVTVTSGQVVTLAYDALSQIWRILSIT